MKPAAFLLGALVLWSIVNLDVDLRPEVKMPPRQETLTLPQKCRQFLRPRTEDEWDEERQEYWPPNDEWETCMGVERK